MGVGFPLVRREENNFRREFPQCAAGCRDWIDWLIHERNIKIQSAFHGGGQKIGLFKVDSFCQELNTVFEFYGDYWNCHTDQLPDESTIHPTIKDKDGNPLTVRIFVPEIINVYKTCKIKAIMSKSSGKKIGKLS